MELSFSELRAKEVVNIQDGKKLGKVCDLCFSYPENKVLGLIVPSGHGFGKKNQLFVDMKCISKIGEDVILINISAAQNRKPNDKGCKTPPEPPRCQNPFDNRRSFEEYE